MSELFNVYEAATWMLPTIAYFFECAIGTTDPVDAKICITLCVIAVISALLAASFAPQDKVMLIMVNGLFAFAQMVHAIRLLKKTNIIQAA